MNSLKVMSIQSRICIGGPALQTELLSKHLPVLQYKSVVISGKVDSSEFSRISDLRAQGIPVHVIPEMKRISSPVDDIKAIVRCYKIIKQEKPDIVHTHTAKAGTVGRIAAWLAGVPKIYHTFHGHTFHSYFSKPVTAVFILIERLLARLSTAVIAISPSQQDELVNRYHIAPAQRFRMIRLGLELEPFSRLNRSTQLKTDLSLSPDTCLLAVIGRLVPIKNIEMALRVLSRLDSHYHLCVVGDGPEHENLESLASTLDIQDRVHFLGWIENITGIYAEIDALLLTSNNEGTPVAVIEAMAASVPVVATCVGGVPDLVKHKMNGYLCDPHDTVSMGKLIIELCQNRSKTKKVCTNAMRFVNQFYSADRLLNDINHLYQHIY